MSDIAITERQQYWLDHIQAAGDFDGTLAEYARSAGLKPKELYSWKSILGSRGLLDPPAASSPSGFVQVISRVRSSGVSLVLPNGIRLECHGELGPEQLEALVVVASRLP
ncbi:MAG: hypothetical protein EA371_13950 [Gammaproteobacteria bacterium]|nr:MAG: hypothetical protein EA371_13950 [Gammaproteobacteria bacterium]